MNTQEISPKDLVQKIISFEQQKEEELNKFIDEINLDLKNYENNLKQLLEDEIKSYYEKQREKFQQQIKKIEQQIENEFNSKLEKFEKMLDSVKEKLYKKIPEFMSLLLKLWQ